MFKFINFYGRTSPFSTSGEGPGLRVRRTLVLLCIMVLCTMQSFSQTKFGVMINGTMSVPSKIAIVNSLGAKYVRMGLTMADWSGSSPAYEKYRAANLPVLLNLQWSSHNITGAPIPFNTDLVQYAGRLTTILNKYSDEELIVIENEETQKTYHSGPMSHYIAMLEAAIPVVHGKGLKLTNGGIHPPGVCYYVYLDYVARGLTDSANWWKNETFNTGMLAGLSNPNATIHSYWREIDTLLTAYETLDLDYINLHIYEPLDNVGDGIHVTANSIAIMADYVSKRCGKPVITNETGQTNTDPDLVTNMLAAYAAANYEYAIWWSGDGNNAFALNEPNGILRSNGIAYRDFVNNYNDTTITGGDDSSNIETGNKKSYDIHSDTTKFRGRGTGSNEVVFENETKNIIGALYNIGNGITAFRPVVDSVKKINDSTLRVYRAEVFSDITVQGAGGGSSTDTTSLSNRINLKVNIADTAAMLAPYLRNNIAAATYEPKITAGTTAEYIRGDKSLATFPTNVSTFNNDAGYLTEDDIILPPDYTGTSRDVLDILNTPPASPVTGDQYLVGTAPTGDFATHANDFAYWNASSWEYTDAVVGDYCYTADDKLTYLFQSDNLWHVKPGITFLQNGQAMGALQTIGPSDNFPFRIKSNNIERFRINANGSQRWQSYTGANNAFVTLDASGNVVRSNVGTGFIKGNGSIISYDNNSYTPANSAITGDTKTKITYDSKGLVTAGADATTTDINEGSNLYFTDARARSALSASGSLSYNSSTGVFSYTQPANVSVFSNDAGYLTTANLSNYVTLNTAQTITASKTFTINTNDAITFDGSYTQSGVRQRWHYWHPIITGRATTTDTTIGIEYNPSFTAGAANQRFYGMTIKPDWNANAKTGLGGSVLKIYQSTSSLNAIQIAGNNEQVATIGVDVTTGNLNFTSFNGGSTFSGTLTAGNLTSNGNITYSTNIGTSSSNLHVADNTKIGISITNSTALFSGASTVYTRLLMNGSSANVGNGNTVAGISYSSHIIAGMTFTTATTGTHQTVAQQVINAPVVTNNGATVVKTALQFLNTRSTATVSGKNYGLYDSSGLTALKGGIEINRTPVADAAYTILATDYLICYTTLTANRAVTLPSAASVANQTFLIKDESGSASAINKITIIGTVNGVSNPDAVIAAYGSYKIYSNGTSFFTQ